MWLPNYGFLWLSTLQQSRAPPRLRGHASHLPLDGHARWMLSTTHPSRRGSEGEGRRATRHRPLPTGGHRCSLQVSVLPGARDRSRSPSSWPCAALWLAGQRPRHHAIDRRPASPHASPKRFLMGISPITTTGRVGTTPHGRRGALPSCAVGAASTGLGFAPPRRDVWRCLLPRAGQGPSPPRRRATADRRRCSTLRAQPHHRSRSGNRSTPGLRSTAAGSSARKGLACREPRLRACVLA